MHVSRVVVSAVYRPLTLDELVSLVDLPDDVSSGDYEILQEIVALCGSFLTLREHTIFFVHQSAKDFLLQEASKDIFPAGIKLIHHSIFLRSIQAMTRTLRRDIYGLGAPGYSIDHVIPPNPDPLAAVRYSCIYWVDHLHDCSGRKDARKELEDGSELANFLRQKYLYWLEALSLFGKMPSGMLSMAKLEGLLQVW